MDTTAADAVSVNVSTSDLLTQQAALHQLPVMFCHESRVIPRFLPRVILSKQQ